MMHVPHIAVKHNEIAGDCPISGAATAAGAVGTACESGLPHLSGKVLSQATLGEMPRLPAAFDAHTFRSGDDRDSGQ
jgi:hypothetical protein